MPHKKNPHRAPKHGKRNTKVLEGTHAATTLPKPELQMLSHTRISKGHGAQGGVGYTNTTKKEEGVEGGCIAAIGNERRKTPKQRHWQWQRQKQAQSAQYTTIITFKEIVFFVFIHWFSG